MIKQAYRFELDPNREQRVLLAKSVGASRFVYNWGLAESKRQYELTGKRPRLGALTAQLVELKQTECPWLYEVSAHIGQSALKGLNVAFERFFESLKRECQKSGYPRFKRKGERDSARLYEVTLEERPLRMPNVGRVRLKETCIERGFQQALRKNLEKLRRLDRQLARKHKGSANREKAKLRRARLHYRISCQRQDTLHQLSSSLARTKSVIVLEDLHVRGMQQNKHLALSVSDAGMGELRRQLTYKSDWYGSALVIADRFYPSSKLCSGCGVIKDTLSLSERTFDCNVCGVSLDRDENAALNLRRLALAELPVDRREVTPVERKALTLASASVKPASVKQEATANGTRRSTRRSTSKG